MTISSQTRKAGPFIGSGAASAFPFTFKVFQASDLYVVRLNSSTSVESVLVLNSDYTVSLNADQNANPGGTITLTAGALATGYTLTVTSSITPLQSTDLTNQGGFYPSVITNALDKLTILVQQLTDKASRAFTIPLSSSSSVNTTVPLPKASTVLGWDGTAQNLVNYSTTDLGASIAIVDWQTSTFNGTGAQTTFALSRAPGSASNCDVSISGVTQRAGLDYTLADNVITFLSAPPAGTNNIAIRYGTTFAQGTVYDGSVYPVKLSTGGPTWDSTGNFGVGITPTVKLDVNGSARLGAAATLSNSSSYLNVQAAAQLVLGAGTGSPVTFRVNGSSSDSMTLDAAGNLGVGVTPGASLDVVADASANAVRIRGRSADNIGNLEFRSNDGATQYGVIQGRSGTSMRIASNGATYISLYTNGLERMRIDSSGNVGVGVTPSAWTAYTALELGAAGNAVYSISTETGLTSNAYYGTGWKYAASSIAPTRYASGAGSHIWYNAASGTVGTAITWTQAMTLDASGNLGVGTSSPSGKLEVAATDPSTYITRYVGAPGGANLYLQHSRGAAVGTNTIVQAGDTLGTVVFSGANGTTFSDAAYIQAQVDNTPGASADMPGRLLFYTSADGSATPTERMRIDSSGNVGLGTTTPGTSGTGGLSGAALQIYRNSTGATILLQSDTASNATFAGQVYSSSASFSTALRGYRLRGTVAAPTAAIANDAILSEQALAYDGTSSRNVSTISHYVGTVTTTNDISGYITFSTRPTGAAATLAERMRIDDAGNVLVTGVGGLGYGTGSGGAVTQITSRTTGVTLNKTNGAITLVSAAGSATYQTFTVTNSTVAATDVPRVVQKSGTDKYLIHVTNVSAGSFDVTFATTGGTTTEQPVFNFAVIKAVTA